MAPKDTPPSSDPLFGNAATDLLREAAGTGGQPPSDPRYWEPPAPGELQARLEGYAIEAFLARGGMGAVYRGIQTSLERPVAIKILPPQLGLHDPSFLQRFKQEARAMAQLNHPGIVKVFDFGEISDRTLFFIMEFIDGTDVAKMVAHQGRLSSAHAIAITAHVCDALQYAHELGIVHRDIKPANIMVSNDGQVKVADFGLAKSFRSGQTSLTMTGHVMGTMHFVAPEALTLGSSIDHRADIYAMGVMLYQMLTGRLPQGIFEMPSLLVNGLDPRYDQIIASAMREDRNARYQSISEMRLALDGILTKPMQRSEVAKQSTASPTLPQAASPPKPEPGQQYYRPPPAQKTASIARRMPNMTSWLLASAVVLTLSGIVWMKMRNSPPPPVAASNSRGERKLDSASVRSLLLNYKWHWTGRRLKNHEVTFTDDGTGKASDWIFEWRIDPTTMDVIIHDPEPKFEFALRFNADLTRLAGQNRDSTVVCIKGRYAPATLNTATTAPSMNEATPGAASVTTAAAPKPASSPPSVSAPTAPSKPEPEYRTFTDTRGRQIRAVLVKISGEDIVLRKEDGIEYTAKAATLCAADIEYLKTKRLVLPQAAFVLTPSILETVWKNRCNQTQRLETLYRTGGVPEAEASVSAAFEYLKHKQNPDGSWGTIDRAGKTALALMAYVGRCETLESPFYGDNVMKGIMFLIETGKKNSTGLLCVDASSSHAAAEHGIATEALGQMYLTARYGSKSLPGMREAFEKGVRLIIESNPPGSDRARRSLSTMAWQSEALNTAKLAGLKFAGLDECIRHVTSTLRSLQNAEGGFVAQPPETPQAITGACLRTLQLFPDGGQAILDRGIRFARQHFQSTPLNYKKMDLFPVYFYTRAFYRKGGDDWRFWNQQMLPQVLSAQRPDGSFSTTPSAFMHGGDIENTALGVLILETYYRDTPK